MVIVCNFFYFPGHLLRERRKEREKEREREGEREGERVIQCSRYAWKIDMRESRRERGRRDREMDPSTSIPTVKF